MTITEETLRQWKELRTGYWPTDLANASAVLNEQMPDLNWAGFYLLDGGIHVHEFAGHIACDARSRSELVVPLLRGGEVWGVLDLDSPTPGRFTPEEGALLERFCALLLEPWGRAPWLLKPSA